MGTDIWVVIPAADVESSVYLLKLELHPYFTCMNYEEISILHSRIKIK